jgi:hypothetical protein
MLRESALQGSTNPKTMWGARRGPQARAASLRADAKQALERLADAAQYLAECDPVDLTRMAAPLALAAHRLHVYCQYLQRELEPTLMTRGAFGALTASYLKHFERHWRDDLAQLEAQLERAPHSVGMAQSAFVAAVMLMAELDAHGKDVASALRHDVVQA